MAQFSESAYSHALFSELHAKYKILDFVVPSTRAEGTRHLGYDLKALIRGDWYFFQFKVPAKVSRVQMARFATNHPYIFQLRHPQHADLQAIPSPHVYYVAPVFDETAELATNFLDMTIEDNSMTVALTSRKFDGKQIAHRHYVSYDELTFEVHSEPAEPTSYRSLSAVLAEPGLTAESNESPETFLSSILKMIISDQEDPLWKAALRTSEEAPDAKAFILVSSIATRLSRLNLHLAIRPRQV